MSPIVALLAAAAYVVLRRAILSLRMRGHDAAFALLNVAAIYAFFFRFKDEYHRFPLWFNLFFVSYLLMVTVQYVTMRVWSDRNDGRAWLAFATPILFLVLIRYTPIVWIAGLFSKYVHD